MPPPAGPNSKLRADAHIKAALRYKDEGGLENTRKAVAHFGRALDYIGFGAPGDIEAYAKIKGKKVWVRARPEQAAAFERASDHMAHAGQAIDWLPDLIPEEGDETTEGVVYQDRHAEGILWYVGKTGGKTALRRKPPEPTEPWVLTKAERKGMQEWYDEHMGPK